MLLLRSVVVSVAVPQAEETRTANEFSIAGGFYRADQLDDGNLNIET